mgnify:CR=1 FL=1
MVVHINLYTYFIKILLRIHFWDKGIILVLVIHIQVQIIFYIELHVQELVLPFMSSMYNMMDYFLLFI